MLKKMHRPARSPSPSKTNKKQRTRSISPKSSQHVRLNSPTRQEMSTTATTEKKQYATIGTHSGTFHGDEALAIAMLRELPEFQAAKIYRSRDQAFLDTLDVLVDVGNVYDPATLRYDHHQRSFQDTFSEKHNIRLSSAGLIYKHYGLEVLKQIILTPTHTLYNGIPAKLQQDTVAIIQKGGEDTWNTIYNRIYNRFIKAADAIDNGVPQYPADAKQEYSSSTSLADRVSRLNPSWIMEHYMTDEQKAELKAAQDAHQESIEQFKIAIQYSAEEFYDVVKDTIFNWLHGRDLVKNAVENRFAEHPSGQVVTLPYFAPWKSHFFDMLKAEEVSQDTTTANKLSDIMFVAYPSGASWRFLAIPLTEGSFLIKPKIPTTWLGQRGADLEAATGIQGVDFVHNTGFTGGAKTKEALYKFFDAALQYNKEQAAAEEETKQ